MLNQSGQTMTETLVLLPVYLLLVFGLIQIGLLGTGLIMVNYAASSIARKVANDDKAELLSSLRTHGEGDQVFLSGVKSDPSYTNKLKNLMVAGMNQPTLRACAEKDSSLTATLFVWTGARISTLPLLAPALSLISRGKDFSPPTTEERGCEDNNKMGPFYLASNGSYFVVRGKASLRLNYQP